MKYFISVPISVWIVDTGPGIMTCGKKHTSNDCSKQSAKTQTAFTKFGFKSYRPFVWHIGVQGSCTAYIALQLNLRELTHVIHQMCAAIPQQYIHRYIVSMKTRYLAVDATPGLYTKYWNEINTPWFDLAFSFVLRVSILTLYNCSLFLW